MGGWDEDGCAQRGMLDGMEDVCLMMDGDEHGMERAGERENVF